MADNVFTRLTSTFSSLYSPVSNPGVLITRLTVTNTLDNLGILLNVVVTRSSSDYYIVRNKIITPDNPEFNADIKGHLLKFGDTLRANVYSVGATTWTSVDWDSVDWLDISGTPTSISTAGADVILTVF